VGEALKSEAVRVVYANDIDPIKHLLFAANYDDSVLHLGDIRQVKGRDIPQIDLATASFPCTDVSLAGNRAGLAGEQSGMFWEFTRILDEMSNKKPRVVLLENVVGFFSSKGGEDLRAAFQRLNNLGYFCDLMLVDARWFVPQSRPRLFIIGSLLPLKPEVMCETGETEMRPGWFGEFVGHHHELKMQMLSLARPARTVKPLGEYVEKLATDDTRWWGATRTEAFLNTLSTINTERLNRLKTSETTTWRTAYRRTRKGVAVWEVREDAISGCLRTARGGSSKQAVVEAGNGALRVRWMTAREYARLQGVPKFNIDVVSENQAMFGFGDAVCVPAVRFIVRNYLVPLLEGRITAKAVSNPAHEHFAQHREHAAMPALT
jgi:DNA (cytosine-5)-methyltransferase 1